ncbi:tetratricopeptide repeat protein [Pontibacter sp. G13]|uniref:tetratricopeptide repeat protein n=1 Tax=Pontibacter sp. G13 TaxID=3074898 RepID=UPI00288AACE9|nr:tetratricopeptide repeat protein [Pontibacter sp. G13]WNJ18740.1 hypothetical protein RJD25_28115 [Pontibacter sp. G13]
MAKSATEYFEEGLDLEHAGRYKRAIQKYTLALQQDPTHYETLLRLFDHAMIEHDIAQARKLAVKIEKYYPKHSTPYLVWVQVLIEEEKFQEANDRLKEFYDLDLRGYEEDFRYTNLLNQFSIDCLMGMEDYEQAVKDLQMMIVQEPLDEVTQDVALEYLEELEQEMGHSEEFLVVLGHVLRFHRDRSLEYAEDHDTFMRNHPSIRADVEYNFMLAKEEQLDRYARQALRRDDGEEEENG